MFSHAGGRTVPGVQGVRQAAFKQIEWLHWTKYLDFGNLSGACLTPHS